MAQRMEVPHPCSRDSCLCAILLTETRQKLLLHCLQSPAPCSQTFLRLFHIEGKFKIAQHEKRDIFTIIRRVSGVYGFLQEAGGTTEALAVLMFYGQIKKAKFPQSLTKSVEINGIQ